MWNEISVKNIWDEVKNNAFTKKHFVDLPKGVLPDRKFFYNVYYKLFIWI